MKSTAADQQAQPADVASTSYKSKHKIARDTKRVPYHSREVSNVVKWTSWTPSSNKHLALLTLLLHAVPWKYAAAHDFSHVTVALEFVAFSITGCQV